MARAYIKIRCSRGYIRIYGGNTSDVRGMKHYYETLSLEQFLNKHNHCTEADYNTLKIEGIFKNR